MRINGYSSLRTFQNRSIKSVILKDFRLNKQVLIRQCCVCKAWKPKAGEFPWMKPEKLKDIENELKAHLNGKKLTNYITHGYCEPCFDKKMEDYIKAERLDRETDKNYE